MELEEITPLHKLQEAERKLYNAISAATAYSEEAWAIASSGRKESEVPPYFFNVDLLEDPDRIARAILLRRVSTPLTREELRLSDHNPLYHGKVGWFDQGIWQGGHIGGATVVHSQYHHISHLTLTFRGTDPKSSSNPLVNIWRNIAGYGLSTYSEIQEHYSLFEPLIHSVIQYANDPSNHINELHISGHSLGGAMVQEFLKRHPKEHFRSDLKVHGYTFGSPGSGDTTRIERIFHGMMIPFKTAQWVANQVFKSEVPETIVTEPRQIDTIHPRDTVAITLGPLLYTRSGHQHIQYPLEDQHSIDKSPRFQFHSMLKYIKSCEEECLSILTKHPELSENSLTKKFNNCRHKAYKIEAEYLLSVPEAERNQATSFSAYKEMLIHWQADTPISERQEAIIQKQITAMNQLIESEHVNTKALPMIQNFPLSWAKRLQQHEALMSDAQQQCTLNTSDIHYEHFKPQTKSPKIF